MKVIFFALFAIVLLVADSHLRSLALIRQAIGTVLYPMQMVALMPRDAAYLARDYFASVAVLQGEVKGLRLQQIHNAQAIQQSQQLMLENAQLRKLMAAGERLPVRSVLAEILYDARDVYSRKIVMNRGLQHGVGAGQPVIDDVGVVGQVTRVFPFTSEITLLTDRDQAIPVMVVRNGLRSVAYGRGQSGQLDLRFIAANADIQKDDMLTTSGIDGIYPPGLSVARVVQVESKSNDAFERVTCQPLAGIDRNKQFLILLTQAKEPIYLPPPIEHKGKQDKAGRQRAAENAKKTPAAVPPVPPAPSKPLATPKPPERTR